MKNIVAKHLLCEYFLGIANVQIEFIGIFCVYY